MDTTMLVLALREGGPLMVAVAASVFVILRLRGITARLDSLGGRMSEHERQCHARDRESAVERERVSQQIAHQTEHINELRGGLKSVEQAIHEIQIEGRK